MEKLAGTIKMNEVIKNIETNAGTNHMATWGCTEKDTTSYLWYSSQVNNVNLIKGKHQSDTKWKAFHKVTALYSLTMLINIVKVTRKTEDQFQIKIYWRYLITKCSILSWEQTSEIPIRQLCPKMTVRIKHSKALLSK